MTTLVQGGVLQRAVSFIQQVQGDSAPWDWQFFISPRVARELSAAGIENRWRTEVHGPSPARNWRQRRVIAERIDAAVCPLVFSFAGPSYLRMRTPELMGVADGWVTHADRNAYQALPRRSERWRMWAASTYKLWWFRRSRRFIVQTETARRGLAARLPRGPEAIAVVPNAVAPWYGASPGERTRPESPGPPEILYFAAHYSHKRHDLLPDVAWELKRQGVPEFFLVTTLDAATSIAQGLQQQMEQRQVGRHWKNLGTIPVSQGAGVYARAAVSFVPSVLETFSATYIESMAAGVPLVVTDLPFAREICGPAALYFRPGSAADAAVQLARLLRDRPLRQELITAGYRQVQLFPTPGAQITMYKEIFRNCAS